MLSSAKITNGKKAVILYHDMHMPAHLLEGISKRVEVKKKEFDLPFGEVSV